MNLEKAICSAFCDGFRVREAPIGYIITSPFTWHDGEPLVIYARRKENILRLEDSGATLLSLEDVAGDLTSDSRLETIRGLAAQHGVTFEEDDSRFSTQYFPEADIGKGVIQFLSFMNRVQDLEFLVRSKVENTFKEDLLESIREHFKEGYELKEKSEIYPRRKGHIADVLITSATGRSAAVYAATQELKVVEALLAAELIAKEHVPDLTPFLVYENFINSAISPKSRTRSMNNEILRLADWTGGKEEIIEKVEASLRQAA